MNITLKSMFVFLATLLAGTVAAQSTYPDRQVRLVVPLATGGAPDTSARVLAQKLSEMWGKAVVVENSPGAAGSIASARVAKAAPDGYTLLYSGDAAMTTNVTLYDKLGYEPLKDFIPITVVVLSTNILVVHPSVKANNPRELAALAKSSPGALSYASGGSGTSQHLGGELFKTMAGVDITHIPYKTNPLQDVITGRVSMSFANVVLALPLIRDGRLRPLAVSSMKRWSATPDIPTMDESGNPGSMPWPGSAC